MAPQLKAEIAHRGAHWVRPGPQLGSGWALAVVPGDMKSEAVARRTSGGPDHWSGHRAVCIHLIGKAIG